jgi:hypothetical protein
MGMKKAKNTKALPAFTYLGCPLTRNRSAWCFRLCDPDAEGTGTCGRVAPHSFKSAIQLAIERHNVQKENGRRSEESLVSTEQG